MGVEYRHFLVAAEPTWLPQADTLPKVDALLRRWALVTNEPQIYDLTGGRKNPVASFPSTGPGPGIAVVYPMVQGPVVPTLFGPSYYKEDVAPDDRYIQGLTVVVGADYRVHWSSEGICFTVVEPPREAGRDVEPYHADQHLYLYSESYPATPGTTPPTVKVEVDPRAHGNVAWKTTQGCGAALSFSPAARIYRPHRGASCSRVQLFVADVCQALGSRLLEVGEIY